MNRQKMAGGFRKASGNEIYCSIPKYHGDVVKKRDGEAGKFKMSIHGHTGYFLAGAKPDKYKNNQKNSF